MEDKALSEEVLVRLNLQPQSLGCVVAQIDFTEKRDCSLFHWRILKSRFLALNFSEIFASPVPQKYQEFQEILVVAHRDLIENGQVDSYLREARLSKKRWTLKCSSDAIEATVRFTIMARLSPEWNPIACKADSETKNGELCFRGREFLTDAVKNPVDTVRVRVFVADSVAWLGLSVCRSRLPRVCLEDLITPRDVENFYAHPDGSVDETHILAPWVNVIPSLKRGRVTHISTGFPVDCAFKKYEDLYEHWRRMYGIILPPSDPLVKPVYASVSFLIGGTPFLYPLECLLKYCPPKLHHSQPESVILNFVENVRRCFSMDVVVDVAGRPIAELLPAEQVDTSQSFPNVQSGPLSELLRRKSAPVVNDEEEMPEKVSEQPVQKIQPGLHFMSNLSKKVRRPLDDLTNMSLHRSSAPAPPPTTSTQRIENLEKLLPVVPVLPKLKPVFRSKINATGTSSTSVKKEVRSLVPPKGKPVFRPMGGPTSKLPEKSRLLVPPKGIFRPTDNSNKVTKKTTERKQPQPKSTADIENLFKVGNLKKATVPQLQMWLRENGFEVKGRAKKEDLIDRVSAELRTQRNDIEAKSTSASLAMTISNLKKIKKE